MLNKVIRFIYLYCFVFILFIYLFIHLFIYLFLTRFSAEHKKVRPGDQIMFEVIRDEIPLKLIVVRTAFLV
jgi:hypothetical protein